MLRPRSVLERHSRAVRLLEKLAKFGELPTPIVRRVLNLKGHTVHGGGGRNEGNLVDALLADDYVTVRKDKFNGRTSCLFKITPKGRAALKEGTKK